MAIGENIDGRVRRISRTYNALGLLEKVTSRNHPHDRCGEIVNQVAWQYNGLGLAVVEYQEHSAAVNVATSPKVQYGFDVTLDGSGALLKGLRPTSLTYPNGRVIQYSYGAAGSAADALNRLDAIEGDGTALSQYVYLGLGTLVRETFVEPNVALDYIGSVPDAYSGFDTFGRVVSQTWTCSGQPIDQFNYAYDRAGNRIYRQNGVTTGKDELYHYDGVNRLVEAARGGLSPDDSEILSPSFSQRRALDATGNWSRFYEDEGGTPLDQPRVHNAANELLLAEGWAPVGFRPYR